MSATSTIFYPPTFNLSSTRFPRLKPLKPNSLVQFPSSKSVFFGGFVCRKAGSTTMTELVRISSFRRNNGDEGVRVLEQEALVEGSTELMAGGLESTLNRLSKWLVSALFGVVILCRHDAEAVWAAMGSVANAMLSVSLKQILNQERPIPTSRSDPGMPSSHSQSIFFIVMFAILSIVEWLGINEITLTISGLALAFGSYLSWLRVSQQLHTISQVVVGAAVGSIFCILWFLSWNAIVLEAFNSSLWVRIIVVLGAAGFCLGFLLYVIRYWLRDER